VQNAEDMKYICFPAVSRSVFQWSLSFNHEIFPDKNNWADLQIKMGGEGGGDMKGKGETSGFITNYLNALYRTVRCPCSLLFLKYRLGFNRQTNLYKLRTEILEFLVNF